MEILTARPLIVISFFVVKSFVLSACFFFPPLPLLSFLALPSVFDVVPRPSAFVRLHFQGSSLRSQRTVSNFP